MSDGYSQGLEKKDVEKPVSNAMAAFSEKLNDLSASLDLLYIINNASGRHRFRDKWPEVAEYLFDPQLTEYDFDGFSEEQREDRARLEEEADMRRIDLKKTISEFVTKSVDSGSLQFDYVGSIIDKYGAVISQYLYKGNIVERVRPGIIVAAQQVKDVEQKVKEDAQQEKEDEIRARASALMSADEPVINPFIGKVASTGPVSFPVQQEIEYVQEPQAETIVQGNEDEARLSAEEKDLLSNRNTEIPENIVQQQDYQYQQADVTLTDASQGEFQQYEQSAYSESVQQEEMLQQEEPPLAASISVEPELMQPEPVQPQEPVYHSQFVEEPVKDGYDETVNVVSAQPVEEPVSVYQKQDVYPNYYNTDAASYQPMEEPQPFVSQNDFVQQENLMEQESVSHEAIQDVPPMPEFPQNQNEDDFMDAGQESVPQTEYFTPHSQDSSFSQMQVQDIPEFPQSYAPAEEEQEPLPAVENMDSLEQVRPIETPVPEDYVLEGEPSIFAHPVPGETPYSYNNDGNAQETDGMSDVSSQTSQGDFSSESSYESQTFDNPNMFVAPEQSNAETQFFAAEEAEPVAQFVPKEEDAEIITPDLYNGQEAVDAQYVPELADVLSKEVLSSEETPIQQDAAAEPEPEQMPEYVPDDVTPQAETSVDTFFDVETPRTSIEEQPYTPAEFSVETPVQDLYAQDPFVQENLSQDIFEEEPAFSEEPLPDRVIMPESVDLNEPVYSYTTPDQPLSDTSVPAQEASQTYVQDVPYAANTDSLYAEEQPSMQQEPEINNVEINNVMEQDQTPQSDAPSSEDLSYQSAAPESSSNYMFEVQERAPVAPETSSEPTAEPAQEQDVSQVFSLEEEALMRDLSQAVHDASEYKGDDGFFEGQGRIPQYDEFLTQQSTKDNEFYSERSAPESENFVEKTKENEEKTGQQE